MAEACAHFENWWNGFRVMVIFTLFVGNAPLIIFFMHLATKKRFLRSSRKQELLNLTSMKEKLSLKLIIENFDTR